jgi:hypothetical protein
VFTTATLAGLARASTGAPSSSTYSTGNIPILPRIVVFNPAGSRDVSEGIADEIALRYAADGFDVPAVSGGLR